MQFVHGACQPGTGGIGDVELIPADNKLHRLPAEQPMYQRQPFQKRAGPEQILDDFVIVVATLGPDLFNPPDDLAAEAADARADEILQPDSAPM
jgi:hypothetical protein